MPSEQDKKKVKELVNLFIDGRRLDDKWEAERAIFQLLSAQCSEARKKGGEETGRRIQNAVKNAVGDEETSAWTVWKLCIDAVKRTRAEIESEEALKNLKP